MQGLRLRHPRRLCPCLRLESQADDKKERPSGQGQSREAGIIGIQNEKLRLKKLSLYVTDGRYKIDNNMVENSIRPLAVGRKNYLFCGDDTAQRTAVVYSLLATCKAHGVNERAWLEDVLRRIPEYEQAGKDYADLLPANWRALSAK